MNKKRFLRFLFALICTFLPAFTVFSFASEKLTIEEFRSWPQNGQTESVSPGLEVSYSPDFEHPELKFVVNGKEAICREGGGGFGGGYYDRSFYVYAGNPGEKNLEVILISKNEKLRRLWQVKIF